MSNNLPKKISLENDLRDELEAAEARITELERQVAMWADACNTAITQRDAAKARVAKLEEHIEEACELCGLIKQVAKEDHWLTRITATPSLPPPSVPERAE